MDLGIMQTTDTKLIKQIMCDDRLFKASMPDEDVALFESGDWEPGTGCIFLNYEDKAIVRLYPLTNIAVDAHFHLKSEYWGTSVSSKLEHAVEEWLKANTQYCKIVLQTPQCCREVLKAATREGYTLEGILTAAILWRGKIENVILMSKFIRRSNHG